MSENSGIRLLHPVRERWENHRNGAHNVARAPAGRDALHAKTPARVRETGTCGDPDGSPRSKNSSVSRTGNIPVGDGVNPGRIGDSVNP